MFRAASLALVLGALAFPAAAAPLEAPLKNQTAVLAYEVEVTGQLAGKPVHDRLVVRTPVFARESGALNPLADGFTDSQNAEIADMAAATGDDDGTAAMLELNRLIEAMAAVCLPNEGPGCAAARARYQAAEQRMADHGAQVAAAQQQAQARRSGADDHRFLMFMAGEGPAAGPATVEARYDHGGRRGELRWPDPAGLGQFFSVGDMVVLDRRDGSLFLAVNSGILKDGRWIVDVQPLVGATGVKRVGLPFSGQVTLAGPQPTAGPEGDYAGSKTIETKGLRYVFRWKLERD